MTSSGIDSSMLGHYSEGIEQDRLARGRGQMERLRTQEILARHLPPPPAVVLDVGGAAGVHALWLAAKGYEAHLIDPVPLHIEQATRASEQADDRPLARVVLGDARHLDRPDASIDIVLLLGPLYHLPDREDRLQALREAKRVVRSGGVVFAVGISRFASLCSGLSEGFLADPAFGRIVAQDLRDGQHRNPTNHPGYFTTAFFHHPDELQAEVREVGLEIVEFAGIEGPASWMVPDFPAWWDDPTRRELLLMTSRAVEHEPTLMGLGPHLMVVANNG
ncbi:MAG: class I SAM-dependent methyltransferase [Thermomicrobiales bacterium]